jgi:drug/metabolite transporter (DMT)-like permease
MSALSNAPVLPFSRLAPLAMLAATGALLGGGLVTGRLAIIGGVAPSAWAFWSTLLVGLLLCAFAVSRQRADSLRRGAIAVYLRYALVIGLISVGLPYFILFTVIEKLGAGLTGTVYTLPTLLTLALALLLRVEYPVARRLVGLALGFIGALLILVPRSNLPAPGLISWLLLALLIPLSLACGNLYRTLAWPRAASPITLAGISTLAGAGWILIASLLLGSGSLLPTIGTELDLLALQAGIGSLCIALHFRLQQVAGPVFASQIGYVATATGLALGALLLGERYSLLVLLGALVVSGGVAIVAATPTAPASPARPFRRLSCRTR